MLIHSVMPRDFLLTTPEEPQRASKATNFGFIDGCDTPQGFQVSRVITTDLSVYLKKEYAPGQILR